MRTRRIGSGAPSRAGRSLVEMTAVITVLVTLMSTGFGVGKQTQISLRRDACVDFADQLRDAELAAIAERDVPIELAPNPRAMRVEAGTYFDPGAEGWSKLGLDMSDPAPGRYEVRLTKGGFFIRATCDVDHDGQVAHVTASTSQRAKLDPRDAEIY